MLVQSDTLHRLWLLGTDYHYSTVDFRTHGIGASRTDDSNICPFGYIALAVFVLTNRHHGTVRFQAHSMKFACTDGNNICPSGYIALTISIITNSHHSAV